MNLKSYLRGIGIGVLVTAAVFLISESGNSTEMTDAQIKARAKELGMIEQTTLADVGDADNEKADEETVVMPTAEVIEDTDEINAGTDSNDNQTTIVDETATASEDVADEVDKDAGVTTEIDNEEESIQKVEQAEDSISVDSETGDVVIVVNKGDGSDTVSKKLFDAGIVDNAHEFDVYLMSNGYDRKITTGNHIIKKSYSEEEIAKNLVSSTK